MQTSSERQPSMGAALAAIVGVVGIFIVGIGILQYPPELMLLFSAVLLIVVSACHGKGLEPILDIMGDKVKRALPAILILLSIGLLIGSWMIAGTIPMLVYIGLKIIHPDYLYLIAFIVTAIISMCTGTSWGAAGTIGVAIISVAQAMGLSLPVTAGAIVSGAYLGDKLSPLSDSTNMSSIAANVNLFAHIQNLLYTAIPSMLIALLVFWLVGDHGTQHAASLNNVHAMMSLLADTFHFGIVVIVPAIVVLVGSLMKRPPLIVLFISSVVAMLIAFGYQGAAASDIAASAVSGFNVNMVGNEAILHNQALITLFERGGLYSMYSATFFIFIAFLFASALESSRVLVVVLKKILPKLKTLGGVTISALLTGVAVINFTSNSYVAFFILNDMFREIYYKHGMHPLNLSRHMEDSITLTEVLMPWTVSGVFMATTLGVGNFEFLPWAIFNVCGFVFSALYALLSPLTNGFGMKLLNEPESGLSSR